MEQAAWNSVWDLPPSAAIDFGASNTDVVAVRNGRLVAWSEPANGAPAAEGVRRAPAAIGLEIGQLALVAVTGGHHRTLPEELDGTRIVKVAELDAIARGGQALTVGGPARLRERILVVSAGSGTAMVAAEASNYRHVTGTGVGGGTLLGLGRLLLDTMDPREIDRLALIGEANAIDLGLQDVVTGPIGSLPPDATAVNFGRVARNVAALRREDVAAALVTLVGQVIATLAINACRAAAAERIVVTGHLTDMGTMRSVMSRVSEFFGFPVGVQAQAGSATATGALLRAWER